MISCARPAATLVAAALALSVAGPALAGTPAEDFAAADADSNRTLDPTEFRAYIALAAAAKRGQAVRVRDGNYYDRAFARIDANKDGRLSRVEMKID